MIKMSSNLHFYTLTAYYLSSLWQMEFVQPQNWQPKEGRYPAELVFIRGVEWPVVLLTSDGLLYPRLKPRRVPGGQR